MHTKQKKKLTLTEKIIIAVCCIIVFLSTLFSIYVRRYDLVRKYYNDYVPEALELSEEQKLQDFEYYYSVMVSSFPMLDEYEEVMGFDFAGKKEYYEELVKNTKSDYEFFCVMTAIANEFPSFHTDLVFPSYARYESLGCYNMTPTLCNKKVYPASVYWADLLKKERDNLHDICYTGYNYIDGEYVLISDIPEVKGGTRLVEINGQDIHEYVLEKQFTAYRKKYDSQNNILYLEKFYVNNKLGEPVTLTLQDTDGSLFSMEAFCEKQSTAGLMLCMAYDNQFMESAADSIVYDYIDKENNIGYIRIKTFSMPWAEDIETKINEMEACEAVILDLRGNYGGVPMLPQKYIYPLLFEDTVKMENQWYMIDSANNKCVVQEAPLRALTKLKLKKVKNENYFCGHRIYEYTGEAEKDKKVYVLIDSDTGSAADGFAAALKNTSATIIGGNTGGEGLANSFVCDYLPNSGLVFTYMFGKASNQDGTDNSLFGTAPDIYSYLSAEGYAEREKMINRGIDPYTYENRLKWDNVLLDTIDIQTKY